MTEASHPAVRCFEAARDALPSWLGRDLTAEAVHVSAPLPDATVRAVVLDRNRRPVAFAACSSPVRPDFVALAVRNAGAARELFGPTLGSAVMSPLTSGVVDGLSYAIYPYHAPFSTGGVWWRLSRRRLGRAALRWLMGIARAAGRSAPDTDACAAFDTALDTVEQDARLDPDVRRGAASALRRLEAGAWAPRLVLDHNDFWVGNLLRAHPAVGPRSSSWPFIVIDWTGANLRGFGVQDAIRIATGTAIGGGVMGPWFRDYAGALGCEPQDLGGHMLAGVGHLGMNLHYYPVDRYVAGARSAWNAFRAIVPVP